MTPWQNIPFFCILVSIASAAFTSVMKPKWARNVFLTLCTLVLASSAYLVSRLIPFGASYTFKMGHYSAPWGNEIRIGLMEAVVATGFAAIMLASTLGGMHKTEEVIAYNKQQLYYVTLELLLAALMVQVYTNDLFTAYVFVEIMTIAACTLITANHRIGRNLEAAARYMIMNLIGSGLFLLGLVLLYDLTGHLLMSNIRQQVTVLAAADTYRLPLTVSVALMTAGLSIKSALYPFHTWVRDAYGYSIPTSAAVLSSLVSKGYIILLIKIIYRVIGMEVALQLHVFNVLYVFALIAMIGGSISAIRTKDISLMIAYSSVAQIGYIFMGIGMGTDAGMAAAVFHILSHGVCKSMLFISTNRLCEVSGGSRHYKELRGSGLRSPLAGLAFTIGGLSMIGIPFLGGFISKINFASASFGAGQTHTILTLAVLAVSTMLNTWYFMKTIITLYRAPVEGTQYPQPQKAGGAFCVAMIAFIAFNVVMGTCAQPIMNWITTGLGLFA